jgi:hypothetical protein
MTSRINLRTTAWLLASGLALGTAAVQAAGDADVALIGREIGRFDERAQEAAITVGMGATQVRQILGRTDHVIKPQNAPGPTWIYHVMAPPFGDMTEFDVNFGSDGKVVSVGTRMLR